MEDKGYFSRFACTGSFRRRLPGSADKNVLLFLVQGDHLSQGRFYDLLLGRKGEGREPFLHLLSLKCLQLKIINMPKQYIWGWHVLNHFTPFAAPQGGSQPQTGPLVLRANCETFLSLCAS